MEIKQFYSSCINYKKNVMYSSGKKSFLRDITLFLTSYTSTIISEICWPSKNSELFQEFVFNAWSSVKSYYPTLSFSPWRPVFAGVSSTFCHMLVKKLPKDRKVSLSLGRRVMFFPSRSKSLLRGLTFEWMKFLGVVGIQKGISRAQSGQRKTKSVRPVLCKHLSPRDRVTRTQVQKVALCVTRYHFPLMQLGRLRVYAWKGCCIWKRSQTKSVFYLSRMLSTGPVWCECIMQLIELKEYKTNFQPAKHHTWYSCAVTKFWSALAF